MKLGEILEEYRSTHNLSQRRFATMCNLSNGFMSMLERGINNHTGEPITPTLDTLNKISMGMGIPLDSLLRSLDSNQCISLEPTEFSLTDHEQSVITAYRDQPEKQPQVDTILGVEPTILPLPSSDTLTSDVPHRNAALHGGVLPADGGARDDMGSTNISSNKDADF